MTLLHLSKDWGPTFLRGDILDSQSGQALLGKVSQS